MAKKRSREEVSSIIDETIGLLIKANNYLSIVKHIAKTYAVSERQAKEYIARARARIIELYSPDLASEKVISGIQFNDLYQKNYKAGNYKECRQVREAFNKLIGANEPEKTDSNVSATVHVAITKEDVELFKQAFSDKYK